LGGHRRPGIGLLRKFNNQRRFDHSIPVFSRFDSVSFYPDDAQPTGRDRRVDFLMDDELVQEKGRLKLTVVRRIGAGQACATCNPSSKSENDMSRNELRSDVSLSDKKKRHGGRDRPCLIQ
jgi:hypothetical protein